MTIVTGCMGNNYGTSVSLGHNRFSGGPSSYNSVQSSPSYKVYNQGGVGGETITMSAIQSRHNIRYVDVPVDNVLKPSVVQIASRAIPVVLLFKSTSTQLNVRQLHETSRGSTQETNSEDEPHRLVHLVNKPVIQEIREVISPVRRIVQEIKPVHEEIQTIVAKSDKGNTADGSTQSTATQTASRLRNLSILGLLGAQSNIVQRLAEQQKQPETDSQSEQQAFESDDSKQAEDTSTNYS